MKYFIVALGMLGLSNCGLFQEEVYHADGECIRDNCTSASQVYTAHSPNSLPWE